jgi:hypothetical protein
MIRFALILVASALALGAGAAAAQTTFYDTEGVVSPPDLFQTDGFRPVWQQELQEQRAKKAAEAAAKAKAQSSAPSDNKTKANTAPN